MTAALEDPMGEVHDLVLISLVGIIDPLRAEAVDAVRIAHAAGIDVRMITGDHTVTARAIADELGLGPGVITGTELSHLSDEEVIEQLPQLHVFGRVAPEDKVRLARLMQEAGEVVAMTGDAVNDAAALKQADVGVAMGSGSEVTKQAGKLVLTDDNFATLIHAVDLGRDIYRRISSYVKLQLTILSSVLQLMLYATILNINGGVALFPMQLLFAKFFVVVTVVIGFIVDVPDPGVMQRPPRTPGSKIATRPQTVRWAITGFIISTLASDGARLGTRRTEHRQPLDIDDDGLRRRRSQRRQQRPRDAPRTRTMVVHTDLPLPRLDHPRLGPHLGRSRTQHAPTPPRHRPPHRRPMGPRPRPLPHRTRIHPHRQNHPTPPTRPLTTTRLIAVFPGSRERSMNTIRTYAILWFSGMIAGVIVMERWRRTGGRLIPTAPRAEDGVEMPTASSESTAPPGKPKVAAALVAGAKADAERVHDLVRRMMPFTSTSVPSVAQLRRSNQEATPGNAPQQPA